MCGNAVRCVAHLLVSRGRVAAGPVTVETGRGVLALEVTRTGPRSSRVRVDMGAPILEAAEIPVAGIAGRVVDAACPALGAEQTWWRASGLDPRMTPRAWPAPSRAAPAARSRPTCPAGGWNSTGPRRGTSS